MADAPRTPSLAEQIAWHPEPDLEAAPVEHRTTKELLSHKPEGPGGDLFTAERVPNLARVPRDTREERERAVRPETASVLGVDAEALLGAMRARAEAAGDAPAKLRVLAEERAWGLTADGAIDRMLMSEYGDFELRVAPLTIEIPERTESADVEHHDDLMEFAPVSRGRLQDPVLAYGPPSFEVTDADFGGLPDESD